MIVLTGMDITTAILLIDMIMRYQRQRACPGTRRWPRPARSGSGPILMTSMITIIVMIPVAFFPKTGMDAYSRWGRSSSAA